MSAIQKALRVVGVQPYGGCPCAKFIAAFVESGDPKALAKCPKDCHAWYQHAIESMGKPADFGDEQRRLLEAFARLKLHTTLMGWVRHALKTFPQADEDYHGIALAAYQSTKLPADELPAVTLNYCSEQLLHDGRPTSAGRYLLSLDDSALDGLLETHGVTGLLDLLLHAAPERVSRRAEQFIHLPYSVNGKKQGTWLCVANCELLLKADRQKYEALVDAAFAKEQKPKSKYELGRMLLRILGKSYREPTLKAARDVLNLKEERIRLWEGI